MAIDDAFLRGFQAVSSARERQADREQQASQFERSLAEQQRVNDANIDFSQAQTLRMGKLVQQLDQQIAQAEQINPLLVEQQKAVNEGQRLSNRALGAQAGSAELALEESRATSAGRVAASNAENRKRAFDAQLSEFQGRGGATRDLLGALQNPDGTMPTGAELAADPRAALRAVAAISAASSVTGQGFGEESIGGVLPQFENGELKGYLLLEESEPGGPLRLDPESVDENGEPVLVAPNELAGVIDNALVRLDARASQGAKGGSARERALYQEALGQAKRAAGPAPAVQKENPATAGAPTAQLEAERDALTAELRTIGQQLQTAQDQPRWNPRSGQPRPTGVVATPQRSKLEKRGQEIEQRLRDLSGGLRTREFNAQVPEAQQAHEQKVQQTARTLAGDIRRRETLGGQNFTAPEITNTLATGRPDRTLGQQQEAFNKRVEGASDIVADAMAGQVRNPKTGKMESESNPRTEQLARAQIESLAQSNPAFAALVNDPRKTGVLRKIALNAKALSAGGEPNLALAYQLFQENVETGQLGQIMKTTLAMINPQGGAMDTAEQAVVGQMVAEEMRLSDGKSSPDAIAQRVRLRLQNQR